MCKIVFGRIGTGTRFRPNDLHNGDDDDDEDGKEGCFAIIRQTISNYTTQSDYKRSEAPILQTVFTIVKLRDRLVGLAHRGTYLQIICTLCREIFSTGHQFF
jgi:hypothetical protein